MNHISQTETRNNDNQDNQPVALPVALLDLFAEELPPQHDLKPANTLGSIGTVSSTYGSCVSSISSISTA